METETLSVQSIDSPSCCDTLLDLPVADNLPVVIKLLVFSNVVCSGEHNKSEKSKCVSARVYMCQ